MRPRELLEESRGWLMGSTGDLLRASLEVLLSIDDRLARMENARRQQQENAAAVIASMAGPSVPLSALRDDSFDPLRDCEMTMQDLQGMGLPVCHVCGFPCDDHRAAAGEPPDQPGSDAT